MGRTIQPIIRGTVSGTDHDEVVVLTNFEGGMRRNLCSATMVAPNLVLTARHCVSDTDGATACAQDGTPLAGGSIRADRVPSNLVVFVGKDGVAPDSSDAAKGQARGKRLVVDTSPTVCNHDIALLVLDTKIDVPVATIRLEPLAPVDLVAAVGWGVDETGELPRAREARMNIPLIGVGPGAYPENPRYGYGASEFMIGESACAGDSGGPALGTSGAVVGVASRAGNGKRGDGNYATTCIGDTAHAVYTQLSAHVDLVNRAFAEAGETLWLEGQPDPRAVPTGTAAGPSAPAAELPPVTKARGSESESATTSPHSAPTGGCSLTDAGPQEGSVEYAAGLVALLASVLGLRRRFARTGENLPPSRPRLPSMPWD